MAALEFGPDGEASLVVTETRGDRIGGARRRAFPVRPDPTPEQAAEIVAAYGRPARPRAVPDSWAAWCEPV